MSSNALPVREPDPTPPARLSLRDHGVREACRHKWIESEKAGRDLGEWAIRSWVLKHWHGFLRQRWVEHLEGVAYWVELDEDDYGLLRREFHDSRLFTPIFEMLKRGKENLDVIRWAQDEGHGVDDVLAILEALDVNSARIEFQIADRPYRDD
jgi:hypothetical protein